MWSALGASRWWFGKKRALEDDNKPELLLENCQLSAAQISTGRKALRILALESKQYALDRKDMLIFLYAMGLNPTDDVIDAKLHFFKLVDADTFTFGQLAHIWHSLLQDLSDEEAILRHAFQFFDKDGNGDISIAELRTTMHELGDLLKEGEIQQFISIMDVDCDGVVTYDEFLSTLKASAADLHNMSEAMPEITPTAGARSARSGGRSRQASSASPLPASPGASISAQGPSSIDQWPHQPGSQGRHWARLRDSVPPIPEGSDTASNGSARSTSSRRGATATAATTSCRSAVQSSPKMQGTCGSSSGEGHGDQPQPRSAASLLAAVPLPHALSLRGSAEFGAGRQPDMAAMTGPGHPREASTFTMQLPGTPHKAARLVPAASGSPLAATQPGGTSGVLRLGGDLPEALSARLAPSTLRFPSFNSRGQGPLQLDAGATSTADSHAPWMLAHTVKRTGTDEEDGTRLSGEGAPSSSLRLAMGVVQGTGLQQPGNRHAADSSTKRLGTGSRGSSNVTNSVTFAATSAGPVAAGMANQPGSSVSTGLSSGGGPGGGFIRTGSLAVSGVGLQGQVH